MSQPKLSLSTQTATASHALLSLALFAIHFAFSVLSNVSFKLSAGASAWRSFLAWQIVGNLAGFVTVLALTGLLRFLPMHIAYPVTNGLAMIGVQVMAAKWFFHERIAPAQWAGTFLVVAGIVLISGPR